ncbi:toprim domain-containing protein [Dyadobacter sediminis]|uniref:Toprim domain-containing protein n=1 Tax=Dyadobacter sediminis TaxID=1493691 RepID=A0A5R9K5R7_9BACT|nr:toprim domain-containing protein [Dyadobacter sediminis]TLU88988.1 toprim domain-containing protein [Dyadobacter sediminis]GGC15942.1 DNA primase [Dyadobacter sediminis]
MNAKQLNQQYSIVGFLSHNGFQPASKKGDNYWYISMIRDLEAYPSFKVDINKNLWYDHGIGVGGNLIDLACKIFKMEDVREVIRLITCDFSSFHPQPAAQVPEMPSRNKLRIVKEGYIQDLALIDYLNTRGICIEVANQYCTELTYSNQGHVFRGLGFKNQLGGYELRSKGFKSCIAPKDITFIGNGGSNLLVFEGFMDFLSYLMLPVFHVSNSSYIILNSLSLLAKVSEPLSAYDSKFLFLDNDLSGTKAASYIKQMYPRVIDMSMFYSDHKDLNDYLTQNRKCDEQKCAAPAI